MSRPIFVINGPNLNLLGRREPEIYGRDTLDAIAERLEAASPCPVRMLQSNHEGQLVDWIQDAASSARFVILNPAAYTHTSVAIHDAIRACEAPVIEVHLSNPHAREAFRRVSLTAPVVRGAIAGFGAHGYELALQAGLALTAQAPEEQ